MTDARPTTDPDRLDALAEEFAVRLRRGERPTVAEYAERYPEDADRIRELFPAVLEIEQAAPLPSPLPPVRLGDYRIVREIGRGGMGVVYEAVQESIGRPVALKVLPAGACVTPHQRDRFRREVRASGRLHHTNIVPVFGTGEADGVLFYAMQFIPGTDLDRLLRTIRRVRQGGQGEPEAALRTRTPPGRRPDGTTVEVRAAETDVALSEVTLATLPAAGYFRRAAELIAQAAEAVAHAHAAGVLHRDVKPSNLLLDADGRVWVADFGLAKAVDQDDLTGTGDVLGTPRYMAPERFRGQADARSDVYALGATLYELVTLRPAVGGDTPPEVMRAVLEDAPSAPRSVDPHIPPDLETVVQTAMAKDPDRRYPSAAALAADLRRFLAGDPILARRPGAVERTFRWCRQNPAVASLSGCLFAVLAASVIVLAALWASERDARRAAEGAEDRAKAGENELRDDLERLGRANALIDSGRRHAYYNRPRQADADFTAAVAAKPNHSAALLGRGELYFALGLGHLAAPDTVRAAELQPDPSDVGSSREWFQKAAAFALAGDRPGYDRLRTAILRRIGGGGFDDLLVLRAVGDERITEASLREATLAALLLPTGVRDREAIAHLANALAPTTGTAVGKRGNLPAHLRGFALFRAGQGKEAMRLLEESYRVARTPEDLAMCAVMLAIAQAGAGQDGEAAAAVLSGAGLAACGPRVKAAETLKAADGLIDGRTLRAWGIPSRHLFPEWTDSVAFWVLYREARAAVSGTAADDPRLTLSMVYTLHALGRPAEAEALYAKATAACPTDARYRACGYAIYSSQQMWDRAEAELAAAIERAPDNPDLRVERFRFALQRKQFARADELFVDAGLAAKDRRAFLAAAFEWYADADRWDKAEVALTCLRVADADLTAHRLAKLRYLLSRFRYADAAREYERQRKAAPDDLPLREEAGSAYWFAGRHPEAEAVLTELIERKGDDFRYWNDRGACRLASRQWKAAAADFARAADLDPTRARVCANAALAALKLDDAASAAAWQTRALKLDPTLVGTATPNARPFTYSFVPPPPAVKPVVIIDFNKPPERLRWLPQTINTLHSPPGR